MTTKILLGENDIPTHYYNILYDVKKHLNLELPPPLHPATGKPLGPADLAPIFPMSLIKQEMLADEYLEIPDDILEVYRLYRPTPLFRAKRLEKFLGTPARIYYKYEGASPAGSHKLNTAIAQAYYNKQEGIQRLSTETGAGQWGSALSMACKFLGMECIVYMVKISFNQKPYRRILMETYGAKVLASPTDHTQAGKQVLSRDPNSPGSLGVAISEAVEEAVTSKNTKYSLGSVLNHVLLHQTIIGQEAKKQMEQAGDYPDIVIGCCGGGSNFAGISFSFLADKIKGNKPNVRAIAVEPTACPSLGRGTYAYDFGDTVGLTPLVKMYTLGHDFMPPPIHAGGLRYHGVAPILSLLYKHQLIEAQTVPQTAIYQSAVLFAQTEGILPAPESAHAINVAIAEAQKCTETGKAKTILFNLSGHGFLDLGGYDSYNKGEIKDIDYPEQDLQQSLSTLPKQPE